jgi:indolepyruvate ferredoxin oxidoreductase beta subunit
LTIAALGGQGGGVVTDWLVITARRAGYFVQATSVPGVAQRTGATIYYLEFFPRSDAPDGREPIMALMPNPGDVDIVVASEWMEAGRAINRGLVTQDRTTLIASTHRDYTIGEKIALGDGRASSRELFEIAAAASSSRRCGRPNQRRHTRQHSGRRRAALGNRGIPSRDQGIRCRR